MFQTVNLAKLYPHLNLQQLSSYGKTGGRPTLLVKEGVTVKDLPNKTEPESEPEPEPEPKPEPEPEQSSPHKPKPKPKPKPRPKKSEGVRGAGDTSPKTKPKPRGRPKKIDTVPPKKSEEDGDTPPHKPKPSPKRRGPGGDQGSPDVLAERREKYLNRLAKKSVIKAEAEVTKLNTVLERNEHKTEKLKSEAKELKGQLRLINTARFFASE